MSALASPTDELGLALLPSHAFLYEACDIPPGMTIDEFRARREQRSGRRNNRLARLWTRRRTTRGDDV